MKRGRTRHAPSEMALLIAGVAVDSTGGHGGPPLQPYRPHLMLEGACSRARPSRLETHPLAIRGLVAQGPVQPIGFVSEPHARELLSADLSKRQPSEG